MLQKLICIVNYYGESDVNIFFLLFCINKFSYLHVNRSTTISRMCLNFDQVPHLLAELLALEVLKKK